jgi:hypothetical protein
MPGCVVGSPRREVIELCSLFFDALVTRLLRSFGSSPAIAGVDHRRSDGDDPHDFTLGRLAAARQPSLRRSVSLFAEFLEIFCGRANYVVGVDSLRSNTVRAGAAICRAGAASALQSFVERQTVLRTTKVFTSHMVSALPLMPRYCFRPSRSRRGDLAGPAPRPRFSFAIAVRPPCLRPARARRSWSAHCRRCPSRRSRPPRSSPR